MQYVFELEDGRLAALSYHPETHVELIEEATPDMQQADADQQRWGRVLWEARS